MACVDGRPSRDLPITIIIVGDILDVRQDWRTRVRGIVDLNTGEIDRSVLIPIASRQTTVVGRCREVLLL